MATPRVLTSFSKAPDASLKIVGIGVIQGLTGNPAFPNPLVPLATLQTAIDEFSDALSDQAQGGTVATARKKDKRVALVTLLRKQAGYVEDNCGGNLATLLSSGFAAASTSHTRTALAKPSAMRIVNGNSGQLLVKIKPVANAKCYELRYAVVGADGSIGPWQNGGLGTNSRALALNNLTPGTVYTIQVRAIGGATGHSDWCDASSHMSL